MFAEVDNANRSIDLMWYTPQGTTEAKRVPMEGYGAFENSTIRPMANEYHAFMDGMHEQAGNWIYQPTEVYALLEHLRGTVAFFPIYMAAVFGLSLKEVLSLTWENIDFGNSILIIKSETRIRMIRMSFQLRDVCFDLRARHEGKLGVNGDNLGPICLREDGCVFEAGELCERLCVAADKAELATLDFDQLRFSSAMMLILQGYSPMEIWGWLGQQNCWFNPQPLANCHWTENI